MKKSISILLITLVLGIVAQAQTLNPEQTRKSLVRIEIVKGTKGYACSGFIWKKPEWVVTSLHAMKQGADIKVVYDNKFYRSASVYKVFKNADLVLLKTDIDQRPLSTEVVALKTYNHQKPQFREKLYAQGYHGGSKGFRTTPLEKGDASPETLQFLVVKKDERDMLINLGFPKINLNIYFLSGSLLPGYSGSPIYNTKGDLVAIGNGGLENGATGVSWAIPANYLDTLETFGTPDLPANLEKISLLMSSQVEVDIQSNAEDAVQQQMEQYYQVYEGGDFEFIKTKNRSFEEMYNTSLDTENLDHFAEDLEANKLTIDYDYIRFDLYEDVNNGVTIAVPEDSRLVYNQQSGAFSVDLSNYEHMDYFRLEYAGFIDQNHEIEDVDMAADLVLDGIDQLVGSEVGGFYEDDDYTYRVEYDDDREMVYIMYTGNNTFLDNYNEEKELNIYLTVLRNGNSFFYSMTTIAVPVERLDELAETGLDCVDHYDENPDACEYFEQFMRVLAASHLTTFSGTSFARK